MNARWFAAVGRRDDAERWSRISPEGPGERVRGRPARRHDRRRAEGRAREGGGRVQRSGRRIGRERRLGPHLRRRARRPRQGGERTARSTQSRSSTSPTSTRSAPTCRPASSSRACGRSPSIRSSRRTATSSCTTRRCRSTAPRWSCASRSIRESPDALSPEQTTKTAKVLMNIPQPYYNHYGGMIAFGPDGKLYVGKGDGGWEGDPLDAGQRLDTHLGKMLRLDVDTPDDVPYAVPKDNPFAKADRPQLMSLFGITEQGFAKIKIGVEARDLGLRPAQSVHVPLRQDIRRPLHRRCRAEPLGGDQLAAGRVQGRRELRLEAEPGLPLPSGDRAAGQVPDRRRAAGRRVSARGAVARRAEAQGRLRLLGAGARRRELRRHRQGLSRRRLVLGPAVRRRLGQGRQQVADAGAPAGRSCSSRRARSTRTAPSSRPTATASTPTTRGRPRIRSARSGASCRPTRSRAAPRSRRSSRSRNSMDGGPLS